MVAATLAPSGLISLLNGDDVELQCFALKKLNEIVDQHWPEISESITSIEILYEDTEFRERQLAALVAAKVYYHLNDYAQSKTFALAAGDLFDISSRDEFVETIITYCIDQFITTQPKDATTDAKQDARLTAIVDRMLQRCYDDREYKQAIGIALEAKRLDILQRTIDESKNDNLLHYILETSLEVIQDSTFRKSVLSLLLKHFAAQIEQDHFSSIKCHINLRDSLHDGEDASLAEMVYLLAQKEDEHSELVIYQLAFDLHSSLRQIEVLWLLLLLWTPDRLFRLAQHARDPVLPEVSKGSAARLETVKKIISGDKTIKLHLEFLQRNNKCDVAILNKIRDSLEARNSIFHSGLTFANAFMNAGTTADGFFRDNLEWLSKASNWSKFSATAALGVIHKGNLKQGMSLLGPYLPQEGVTGSVYSEGGSLFALGLIHTNHAGPTPCTFTDSEYDPYMEPMQFLLDEFKKATDEVVHHGCALGIGAVSIGTEDYQLYHELKDILYSDSAIAGEGIGYAVGLIMLGSASEQVVEEMVSYAHETDHEKIMRGVSMALALTMFSREAAADNLIETMTTDDHPIMRYGGMMAIGLAYCGTGNTGAFEKLLHSAVSDVHDDVRRAAVMALGFVMYRNPTALCRTITLLNESYNAHVRYGAAMALGIACAGTALPEALDLLEPMTKDATDFVRQGAFIALAMILVQQNEQSSSRVIAIRKQFQDIITNKHQDAVSKFGATLASGIIDAGGRNVTLRLKSPIGGTNMYAAAGMALFTQFWFWFPTAHFLSLAFTPTTIIGVNKNLDVPQLELHSNAKPALFAYIPETPKQENKVAKKVQTAVLSTTVKAKARAKKVEKEKAEAEADNMDTDAAEAEADDKMETDGAENGSEDVNGKDEEKAKAPASKDPEATSETLSNLARVVPWQLRHISMDKDARYTPVKKITSGGILVMRDSRPTEEVQLIELRDEEAVPDAVGEEEADMPDEFEYPFEDEE